MKISFHGTFLPCYPQLQQYFWNATVSHQLLKKKKRCVLTSANNESFDFKSCQQQESDPSHHRGGNSAQKWILGEEISAQRWRAQHMEVLLSSSHGTNCPGVNLIWPRPKVHDWLMFLSCPFSFSLLFFKFRYKTRGKSFQIFLALTLPALLFWERGEKERLGAEEKECDLWHLEWHRMKQLGVKFGNFLPPVNLEK